MTPRGLSTVLSWASVDAGLLVGMGSPAMVACPIEKVPVCAVLPVLWSVACHSRPDSTIPPGSVRDDMSVVAPAWRAPLTIPDHAVLVPEPRPSTPWIPSGPDCTIDWAYGV